VEHLHTGAGLDPAQSIGAQARLQSMQAEGAPTVETSGLRLDRLAARLESAASERERNGARQRTRDGKFAEPLPGKTERA